MVSRELQARSREAGRRENERARGLAAHAMRMSSGRALDSLVLDPARLPATQNAAALQNGAGAYLFVEGYSQEGGPDIEP